MATPVLPSCWAGVHAWSWCKCAGRCASFLCGALSLRVGRQHLVAIASAECSVNATNLEPFSIYDLRLVRRRSLYDFARNWHRLRSMTELRELRRAADLSQQEFAALMSVPVNTFRMWDSGLRPAPLDAVQRARLAVAEHARNTQFVSLDQLACELGVHVRTLRAAARTGRLVVQLSSRSAFGRPIRFATRSAAAAFMERYYRQSYSRTA
jgi:transcriptional regulator with XRE-family HTH domain